MLIMIKTIKKIISKEELWNRIIFTLSILFIFRIGHYIKVPFVEIDNISSGTGLSNILNMASTFTGGNFSQACLFSLGVSPYISMSLVIQMLKYIAKASDGQVFKKLKEWDDEGTIGRKKSERLTRILSVLISFLYGLVFLKAVPLTDTSLSTSTLFVILMMTGSSICIWLGDKITEKGIGNGISVLMMAGIVARMPTDFISSYSAIASENTGTYLYLGVTLYILAVILFVVFTAYVEMALRKIMIQTKVKDDDVSKSVFPLSLKINLSGVMPVILATGIFSVISIITSNISTEGTLYKILSYFDYSGNWIGFTVYILLIFLFSFFYSRLSFDVDEQVKVLKRNNQVIVGVRPGYETKKYLTKTIKNLSILGALSLVIIAGIPVMLPLVWTTTSISSALVFGGTSFIIMVSVSYDSIKQIKSQLKEVYGFI